MVEKSYIEIVISPAASANFSETHQWKTLDAIYRTLLQIHHRLFSQYSDTYDGIGRSALKYAMPARMWRYGIHTFLEFLRHSLPDGLEYMLSFIHVSYSMVAFLLPEECLGNPARYSTAIKDNNPEHREIWSNIAHICYSSDACTSIQDSIFDSDRIQHDLGVLKVSCNMQHLFPNVKVFTIVPSPINNRPNVMLSCHQLLDRNRGDDMSILNASAVLVSDISGSQSDGDRDEVPDRIDLTSAKVLPNALGPEAMRYSTPSEAHDYHGHAELLSSNVSAYRSSSSSALSFFIRLARMCFNLCGVRIMLFSHIGHIAARPTTNTTIAFISDLQHTQGASVDATDVISLALSLILAPMIPLLGQRIMTQGDRIMTPALICLASTSLIGVAAEAGLSLYISRGFSGISIGAIVWLVLETREKNELPLLQIVRYMGVTAICRCLMQFFLSNGPAEGPDDVFLRATGLYWSCLSSVCVNGLLNPIITHVKTCCEWIAQWQIKRRLV